MGNKIFDQPITPLLTYDIASADMFYAVVGQRSIYVYDLPGKGFRIWGEIPGGGHSTRCRGVYSRRRGRLGPGRGNRRSAG